MGSLTISFLEEEEGRVGEGEGEGIGEGSCCSEGVPLGDSEGREQRGWGVPGIVVGRWLVVWKRGEKGEGVLRGWRRQEEISQIGALV